MWARQHCFGDLPRAIFQPRSKPKSPPSISKSKISTSTINSPNSTFGTLPARKNTDPLYQHISRDVTESSSSSISPDNPHLRTLLNNGTISVGSRRKAPSSSQLGTKAIWKKKSMKPMFSNSPLTINSSTSPPPLRPERMSKMYL